jgi:hypothetical protein
MKPLKSINSYFKREKSINKKLVNILNHKMFKGYRISKESKKVIMKKPKYIEDIYWESKTVDPFDDYYTIEYKKKNLSSLYGQDFSNMLKINNISRNPHNENGSIQKLKVPTQKGESFRKRRVINLRKKSINKDRYFYFCSNSQLIKRNTSENKEKNEILYNTIFQDSNEKGLYNDIPIFAIEKIYRIGHSNRNKRQYKYIKNKEERVNDLQFLYKVSHEKPPKKIDFRNKYNIKSAKSSIMKNDIIRNMSMNFKANSAKFHNKLDFNNFSIVNSSSNIKNFKRYSQIVKKKSVNEIGTQSRDSQLFYTPSVGNLFINQSIFFSKEKEIKNKRKSNSYIFPTKNRIISNQKLIDHIDFRKWKFNILKSIMET